MRAEFFMQSHKWNPRHGRYALRKHLASCGRLASARIAPLAPSPSRPLCIYEGTLVVVHWLHVPLRKCAVWIPPTAALQRCILWAGCARHGTGRESRKSIPGSWIKVGRDREESLSLRLFSRLIGHVASNPSNLFRASWDILEPRFFELNWLNDCQAGLMPLLAVLF